MSKVRKSTSQALEGFSVQTQAKKLTSKCSNSCFTIYIYAIKESYVLNRSVKMECDASFLPLLFFYLGWIFMWKLFKSTWDNFDTFHTTTLQKAALRVWQPKKFESYFNNCV